jgi:hypothetical protein
MRTSGTTPIPRRRTRVVIVGVVLERVNDAARLARPCALALEGDTA